MRARRLVPFCAAFFALSLTAAAQEKTGKQNAAIQWQPWSDAIFAQAKREHRFVLLDLAAVWCHWCHVMDDETYRSPKVIALINAHFLAVKVDQDAHPDLSNRYEDYGWPATVVFNADKSEIVKRRGYLPPQEMASMLQAIIDDPTPGPSVIKENPPAVSDAAALSPELRRELEQSLRAGYDEKQASWGDSLKFLDWDNVEYCQTNAMAGDQRAERMAKATLTAQLQLIDPVWGGVDQYSAEGDWQHPHFEKLIQFQAENIRAYAHAFAQWHDARWLAAAVSIHGYVHDFLTDHGGAFYTSQDADLVDGEHAGDYFRLDDAARRKLGIPRVDKHIYARENGWMIVALCDLYAATGDAEYFREAKKSAFWIIKNRALGDGGFRHGENADSGIFLADTLSMARAFLQLYAVSGEAMWLQRAEDSAQFLIAKFSRDSKKQAGLPTMKADESAPLPPRPQYDENVMAARFGNLLFQYTGDEKYRSLAKCAMRWLATPEVAKGRHAFVGGLLLANDELLSEPLHLTVVGSRSDEAAQALMLAALKIPVIYKRTEWSDPAGKKFPRADVDYPATSTASIFICGNGTCSSPITNPRELQQRVANLLAGPK